VGNNRDGSAMFGYGQSTVVVGVADPASAEPVAADFASAEPVAVARVAAAAAAAMPPKAP